MAKYNQRQILFTGGSGLLGSQLKMLFPKALFPASSQFNVEDFSQMDKYLANKNIKLIVHAAAATKTHEIESSALPALKSNIIGTANIAELCLKRDIKLLYISTDYVFQGTKGNYKEGDAVLPVNKYAWSKLGGEAAVRLLDSFIIVRTSFGPPTFPYSSAFTNQWTSKESAPVIAKKIAALIKKQPEFNGVVHIGAKRRSVYQYASALDKKRQIKKVKLAKPKKGEMARPVDSSLDVKLYNSLTR